MTRVQFPTRPPKGTKMTLVKVTIKSNNKVYASINLLGHGSNEMNFDVARTSQQLLPENFPAFNGTDEEWAEVLANSTEVKKEKIGNT